MRMFKTTDPRQRMRTVADIQTAMLEDRIRDTAWAFIRKVRESKTAAPAARADAWESFRSEQFKDLPRAERADALRRVRDLAKYELKQEDGK